MISPWCDVSDKVSMLRQFVEFCVTCSLSWERRSLAAAKRHSPKRKTNWMPEHSGFIVPGFCFHKGKALLTLIVLIVWDLRSLLSFNDRGISHQVHIVRGLWCWSLSKEQKSSWCCKKKRIVNDSMIVKVWMFSLFLSTLSTIYGSSARQHCFKSLHQKSDKAVKNQSSPSAWFLCPVRFDAFNSGFDCEHLEMDQMDETHEMDQMGEMDGTNGFDLAEVFQKSDESTRGFESNPTSPKSTVKSSQSLRLEPESWQKRHKRAERRGTCALVLHKLTQFQMCCLVMQQCSEYCRMSCFYWCKKLTAQPRAPQFELLTLLVFGVFFCLLELELEHLELETHLNVRLPLRQCHQWGPEEIRANNRKNKSTLIYYDYLFIGAPVVCCDWLCFIIWILWALDAGFQCDDVNVVNVWHVVLRLRELNFKSSFSFRPWNYHRIMPRGTRIRTM